MEKILLGLAASSEPSLGFLCFLGVAVVFVGLVAIIGIVVLMNAVCNALEGKKKSEPTQKAPVATATPVPATSAPIANRSEIIAAVCAAVAEENGTDISAIRVISFKKI